MQKALQNNKSFNHLLKSSWCSGCGKPPQKVNSKVWHYNQGSSILGSCQLNLCQ